MSQVQMLAALQEAEAAAADGQEVRYCLDQTAATYAVSRAELAALWLVKLIACDRARAALASLKDGDHDAEAGGR